MGSVHTFYEQIAIWKDPQAPNKEFSRANLVPRFGVYPSFIQYGAKMRPQTRWLGNPFILHLLLVLLLPPALVYGQGTTATWGLGMDLRLFVAKDDTVTTCPPSVREAERSGGVFPIWQNDGKIITARPALPVPAKKTSLSFRLVNGWIGPKGPFDSNSQTLVQASEPASTGGGCWFSGAGGEIEARDCGADRLSQFYLETEIYGGGGMHIMHNADISQVKNDGQKGQLVANTGVVKANICVYET
ncbi:hypothetical protein IWX90DRAFT_441856 [Phyllosticta citrichinensis]|uniref:Uncharacterized protein n=1 Tax=Phyllosticta citrichinensis TaxID=1130410 RepID=A0ABR1XJ40_9PEZI